MKNIKLLTAAFVVGISTSAMCAVQVNWGTPNIEALFQEYGGSALLPAGSIVQLIYSQDAIIDPITYYDPFTPTGGEELWLTSYIGYDSQGTYSGYAGVFRYGTHTVADTYAGGYVYMRVFQTTNTSSYGDILYYAQGPATAFTNISTDQLQISGTSGFGTDVDLASYMADESGHAPMNLFVEVPEPGTIALAFTAMGFFVIRLFRRKKGE